MSREIERKYLVRSDAWRALGAGTLYRQGYLSTDPQRTVRVRTVGEKAYLTIKGPTEGVARRELEYEIPSEDANVLLEHLCLLPLVEKVRHRIEDGGMIWEVDDFRGVNQGLVVAEVELEREDQEIRLPDWIGEEVSHDPRYYNASLIANPYSTW